MGVQISIPGKPSKMETNYEKQKALSPLETTQGDTINTLLPAAGFIMMKMLWRIKAETITSCQNLLHILEYS